MIIVILKNFTPERINVFMSIFFGVFSALLLSMTANIFAHTFLPDESAEFLTSMEMIKTEANLVRANINNNNTLFANEHANASINTLSPYILNEIAERNERVANELNSSLVGLQSTLQGNSQISDIDSKVDEINAIVDEAITVRIDDEQRNNVTIQALATAHLINEVLNNYGDAYAVGFDMTNISNIDSHQNRSQMNNQTTELVHLSDYQTADALTSIVQEIFNNQLKPNAPVISANFIDELGSSLSELDEAINNKASPVDVMVIVHKNVHPNLIGAFNLQSM